MKKENLVLVHSFPTNSILLKGLIDFLEDHFNVYFIDLPGFTKRVPPLQKINLENYSRYVDKVISELKLPNYMIGGISFGFLVVNNAKLNNKCKGILAIEPYLDSSSLRLSNFRKNIYNFMLNNVILFRIYNIVKVPIGIDKKTFFQTSKIILNNKRKIKFHNLPYVLLINKHDKTINYEHINEIFQNKIKKLLILNTTIKHYPNKITKRYFQSKISVYQIQAIINFVNK